MTQATLTLLNTITNEPIFQITLRDSVTLFYDNSGTGKTALCTLSENPEHTIYDVAYTGVDRLVVVQNNNDWIVLESYKNMKTLILIDEDAVDNFLDKLKEYIGNPGWYFLIITRDDKSLREIKGVRQVLRRLNGYTVINLPDDRDTIYYEDVPLSIDYMYVEDSTTGVELYDAITMGSAIINEGCRGLGGVEYVSKTICSQPIHDNTVFIFDRLTLNQLYLGFNEYIRECTKQVCLFTPICTEWLLLHSDMFADSDDVQKLLHTPEDLCSSENLEHLAFDILKSKDIGYAKEPNNLYWRLLVPSSIKKIGEQLPKPFAGYIRSYTLVGNRHCNINTLVNDIMAEYKTEIAACQPTCEWSKYVKHLVMEHEDITTPDKILKYLHSREKSRSITEIANIPAIHLSAVLKGVPDNEVATLLHKLFGESTTLTDSQIIEEINKSLVHN